MHITKGRISCTITSLSKYDGLPGMIETRFAPSPIGVQHLGSAPSALYSWLYARHRGGQFVLRIEDTDKELA